MKTNFLTDRLGVNWGIGLLFLFFVFSCSFEEKKGISFLIPLTSSVPATGNGLSSLLISSGTLTPNFDNATYSYSVNVDNTVTSVTVTPTTTVSSHTITVNSNSVPSGSPSSALNLIEGANTITIIVTGTDGSTVTYTLTVTRAAATVVTLSTVNTLSALTISSCTLSPSFDPATNSYTATVDATVSSLTVTPTATHSGSTITVNGTAVVSSATSSAITLNTGSNTVTIVVTSESGVINSYSLTVTRPVSPSLVLSSLSISSITLVPSFSSSTTTYSGSASNALNSVTVTPSTTVTDATISVNGVTVSSGGTSSAITMNVGANTISIVLNSSTLGTVTYTITVNKLANNKFRLFLTASTYTGNLGGISGADSKCNNDANKPADGSTYKAVIVNVNENRRACAAGNANCTSPGSNNIDWALLQNKEFFRVTGDVSIFSTNAAGTFNFGSGNASASIESGSAKNYWTGLSEDWTTNTFNAGTGAGTCNTWGDNSATLNSTYAASDQTGTGMIKSGSINCSNSLHLLCAEQ